MPGEDFMQVTDGGNNLFSKEKIQILFARLLYLDPDIYLIDDFFDSLPPQLRDIYFRDLKKYCKDANKTLIYVSAYQSLVEQSNRVFYFNDCHLMENDNHESLMKIKNGHYKEFVEKRAERKRSKPTKRY